MKGFSNERLRVIQSGLTSFLFALSATLWAVHRGVRDYEGRAHSTFSLNAAHTGSSIFAPKSETSWFEVFGVPLYSPTTGLGFRLPTLSSWTQSPLIFMRFLSADFLEYMVAALSIWLALWVVNRTLQSWGGRAMLARMAIADASLLGVAGYEMIAKDWITLNLATHYGIVAVSASLLHRDVIADGVRMLFASSPGTLGVGLGTLSVLVGHPGNWPMALIVLAPSVVMLLAWSKPLLRSEWSSNRPIGVVVALVGCAIVSSVTVGLDVAAETSRALGREFRAGEGLWMPITWLGATRGFLPTSIEEVLSFLWSASLSPLGHFVAEIYWIDTPKIRNLWGSFYRPDFSALLLVIPLSTALALKRLTALQRRLALVACVSAGFMVVTMLLVHFGRIPRFLRPSGLWQVGLLLHPILLVATLALVGQVVRLRRTFSTVLVVLNLSMSLYTTAYQMHLGWEFGKGNVVISALTRHGPAAGLRLASTGDEFRSPVPSADVNDYIQDVRLKGERIVVLPDFPDREHFEELSYLELAVGGVPVAIPHFAKLRSDRALWSTSPMTSMATPFAVEVSGFGVTYSGRLLEFLSVRRVLSDADSGMLAELVPVDGPGGVIGSREVSLFGFRHDELKLSGFRTFFVPGIGSAVGRCPLLEGDCSIISSASVGPVREEPRWRLCGGRCVATFDYDVGTGQGVVLVPQNFDSALRVSLEGTGEVVPTVEVAGLVGVPVDGLPPSGRLRLEIEPDFRMWSRVLMTYVVTAAFVVTIVHATRTARRRNRERGK